MFQTLDRFVECHGGRAQNDNGCDHRVELEEKMGADDKKKYRGKDLI